MSGQQRIDQSMDGRHVDLEDLTLFAMQFLSPAQSDSVARHVEQCPECRDELGLIQTDLGTYAFTVEMEEPPAEVRQRMLRQVAREKKVVAISHPPIASFGRSASTLTALEAIKPARSVGRTILGWSGWAVAAGLAVVATGLYKDRNGMSGTIAAQSGQVARLTAEAANAHQLMDALTDPKAVRVTLSSKPLPKGSPTGGATYNPTKGSLIFLASNLDPLQMYKTYELWLIPADGSASIPAGTFHPDERGNASLMMSDLPKGVAAKGFGVTIEDDGGSQTPTQPIVLAGF